MDDEADGNRQEEPSAEVRLLKIDPFTAGANSVYLIRPFVLTTLGGYIHASSSKGEDRAGH